MIRLHVKNITNSVISSLKIVVFFKDQNLIFVLFTQFMCADFEFKSYFYVANTYSTIFFSWTTLGIL